MIFSTFAYSFLQTLRPGEQEITLPEKNIIGYELTAQQESYLLGLGKTLLKYYYYTGCLECTSQINLLEGAANQFSDQIILEEISTNRTSLTVMSYYGQKDLTNITQENLLDVLCEMMTRPPTICVIRKV